MFCKECGKEIQDGVKFCSECGARISSEIPPNQPAADLTSPIITAYPVFIPWVTIVSILPLQLFFTIWGAGFFGGFGLVGAKAIGLNLPSWFTFVFFGCLAFFGIPFLAYFTKKKTYAKTQYKFFADRLEYFEGFWTLEQKTIKYKNIIEANMKKGVVQKQYGVGTIVLSTNATGGQQGRTMSGIRISDIKNVEEVYNKVLELIH
ncbi:MAG: zinc-ribbon domain-containing protein [Lentisphaeria bacterium]